MIVLKLISKNKNENGVTVSYTLRDYLGVIKTIDKNILKKAIINGQVSVPELKLTSDNRLIENKAHEEVKVVAETGLQKFMIKCRMLGVSIQDYVISPDEKTLIKYRGQSANPVLPPVEIIGKGCFNWNRNIETIELPNTVKVIESSAFSDCTKLTSVKLNEGLETIAEYAFENTAIKEIDIPDTVSSILRSVFNGCTSLKRVKLPKGLKEIKDTTFASCNSLQSINLDIGLETIGYSAFSRSGLYSIEIPESVTKIGSSAFNNCAFLREVKFSNGVKTILADTFSECNIKELILSDSIESIYAGAFRNNPIEYIYIGDSAGKLIAQGLCGTKCKKVEVSPNNKELYVKDGMLYEKWDSGSISIAYCPPKLGIQDIVIDKDVKYIGTYAFADCEINLLKAEKRLWGVHENAFWNAKINKIEIETDDVERVAFNGAEIWDISLWTNHIGYEAFRNSKLVSLKMVVSERISEAAFRSAKICKMYVKAGHIESRAFMNCQIVKPVTIIKGTDINSNAFEGVNSIKAEWIDSKE